MPKKLLLARWTLRQLLTAPKGAPLQRVTTQLERSVRALEKLRPLLADNIKPADFTRMLRITGREADGWWPAGSYTPEDYAAKLKVILDAGDAAGRDMSGFCPALTQICLIGDEGEIDEVLATPMVKSIILMLNAADVAQFGYEHPMGPNWHGIMDFDPHILTREKMIEFCAALDTRMIRDIFPVGTPKQVAAKIKGFADAGMRVYKLLDYGAMGGMRFGANSAAKVRETEDEIQKLCGAA